VNAFQASELAPIIAAFGAGKAIERWEPNHDPAIERAGQWVDDPNPGFALEYQWRVKPELRSWWILVDEDNMVIESMRQTVRPEKSSGGTTWVRVREVLE
jgi:hypothetical protein